MTTLERIGVKFSQDILRNLPDDATEEDLRFYPNDLVAVVNPKNKQIQIVLGCPLCFNAKRDVNDMGYPTINGVEAVQTSEIREMPTNVTDGMKAKLWSCPKCTRILPGFQPKQVVV